MHYKLALKDSTYQLRQQLQQWYNSIRLLLGCQRVPSSWMPADTSFAQARRITLMTLIRLSSMTWHLLGRPLWLALAQECSATYNVRIYLAVIALFAQFFDYSRRLKHIYFSSPRKCHLGCQLSICCQLKDAPARLCCLVAITSSTELSRILHWPQAKAFP